MKSIAVFRSKKRIKLFDATIPEILQPHQVLFRVLDVGICGTDKEICRFEFGTPPIGSEHLILGHECVGEVVRVGESVTRFQLGDLVIPSVRRPCGQSECAPCRNGRQDYCVSGEFTERGIKEAHGFMSELVVEDERFLFAVPKALRKHAVLVEPLAIAEKALQQIAAAQQRIPWQFEKDTSVEENRNRKALVLGAGPIGLLGAMALRKRGFQTFVYSLEPDDSSRATITTSFGSTYISAQQKTVEDLRSFIGNVDVVYEACGSTRLTFEVLHLLGPNAVMVLSGIPDSKEMLSIDVHQLMHDLVTKNQVILGTVNSGADAFVEAVDDLTLFHDRWPIALEKLISQRTYVDQFEQVLCGEFAGIKNVVTFEK